MSKEWAPTPAAQLRDDAQAELAHAPLASTPARPAEELLHELQVHQIELEMQNESLIQARDALEESRDRYADLFDFAPVGYLTLSSTGQITAINLTGAVLLGENRAGLLQRRFAHFIVAADQPRWQKHFLHAFEDGEKQACELRLQGNDPGAIDVRLHSLRGADDTLRITLTDVSERRITLERLRTANQRLENFSAVQVAHLQELAGELTHAEQRERDRLYELLHDEVQPLLVAVRLSLSSLTPLTAQADCLRLAGESCTHISRVIQVTRTLGLRLSPPLIREKGLIPALEFLCRWIRENHALQVELRSTPDAEPANVALRIVCFNAVRELLMNVVKHANTPHATLTLQVVDQDSLRIQVADGGSGFRPAAITGGSGISGIERRLQMFGGWVQIDSQPGNGTVATLSAPLKQIAVKGEQRRSMRRVICKKGILCSRY